MANNQRANVSRRNFIKGGAVAGVAAVAGGSLLAACSNDSGAAPAAATEPANWDAEADVVIVGYGGAGAAAAIEAADQEASVIIMEKAPEGHEGGNTRVSGNMWFSPTPADAAAAYLNAMSGPYAAPEAMTKVWAEEVGKINDWVTSIGGEVGPLEIFNPEYPELPEAQAVNKPMTFANPTAMQSKLWILLDANVKDRDIEILYGTPAKQLVQNPETKEILGVIGEKDGSPYAVKANKGVIMTLGGFENNQQMIHDYLHWDEGYPKGTPYNTGDGIDMTLAVGADLWHMANVAGPDFNFKAPEYDFSFGYTLNPGEASWTMVGADSKRFVNEKEGTRHGKVMLHGRWEPLPIPLPVHMIFDEKVRTAGGLYYDFVMFCWYSVIEQYKWSEDNSAEIEKGWIIQADTIEELAEKIGRDPEVLAQTIEEYNAACAAGEDPIYGTSAEELVPIDEGPFYAMPIYPTFTNTQGGARRNEKAQIVDPDGNPIPRLYSAGEFGSIYGNLYNGGGNVAECMAFGRLAAQNAVAEESLA